MTGRLARHFPGIYSPQQAESPCAQFSATVHPLRRIGLAVVEIVRSTTINRWSLRRPGTINSLRAWIIRSTLRIESTGATSSLTPTRGKAPPWPTFSYNLKMRGQHAVFNYTTTLSPSTIYEFRGGYSRFRQNDLTESAFNRNTPSGVGSQGRLCRSANVGTPLLFR